jgi:hypothetical protein
MSQIMTDRANLQEAEATFIRMLAKRDWLLSLAPGDKRRRDGLDFASQQVTLAASSLDRWRRVVRFNERTR